MFPGTSNRLFSKYLVTRYTFEFPPFGISGLQTLTHYVLSSCRDTTKKKRQASQNNFQSRRRVVLIINYQKAKFSLQKCQNTCYLRIMETLCQLDSMLSNSLSLV